MVHWYTGDHADQQEKLRYDTTWWRGNYCTQNNNVQNTFLFQKKMVICECEKYAPDSPAFHIGSMLRARWWWGGLRASCLLD